MPIETTQFDYGAQRDATSATKGAPSLIPPIALKRLALRYSEGAAKYGANNWMRGIPLDRFYDAILRHAMAWHEGDTSEDHLAAILWNASAAIWTEDKIHGAAEGTEEEQEQAWKTYLNNLPFRP